MKIINVTKSFLPNKKEYFEYLEKIWSSGWLTNNGKLTRNLEEKLKKFLGVKYLFLVNNGTTALQIAIKSLEKDKRDEIITTPFSYVATTSAIVWEGYKPIFADIDPQTLMIDPKEIEQKITKKTRAILATHIFGYPTNVEVIKKIAKKYNLEVIYDAAHTFGSKYYEKSLASYGDISIISFHATKVFHTVEGGVIITNDKKLAHKIEYMRNFGHNGQYDYWGVGINGKISEFHSAMGLINLKYVKKLISRRKKASKLYDKLLANKSFISKILVDKNCKTNYSYYPIIFNSEKKLLEVIERLNKKNIYPRRYFYPSLSELPYIKNQKMPISENISCRIVCLPLFHDISNEEIKSIVNEIY
ncbi:MAG: DegT/DnrJ/EryC1/StrS family aminotransferase [Patescibacteria group bacterium]